MYYGVVCEDQWSNDPKSNAESAVASLYMEAIDGFILNGGISSDFSLIAMLIQTPEGPKAISFYDVTTMKGRFLPEDATDEERENIEWDDEITHFDLPDEINMVVYSLIDPEIFVSSEHKNATIYCTNSITSVFMDKRVFQNNLDGFCVSFSEPDNWYTDQAKEDIAFALVMGLHPRLGKGSNMINLDDDLTRMIHRACFYR